MSDTPRIYVADLAAYNNGELHGVWIDATDDDLEEQAQAMLKPGHEEWAIHDYEGFGSLKVDEYASLDDVHALAVLLEEHGNAFAAYAEHVGVEYATAEDFEEAYAGEFDSEEAFGAELFEELGYDAEIPEHLRFYVDTDRFARDLFLGGDYFSADSGHYTVYVFRSL